MPDECEESQMMMGGSAGGGEEVSGDGASPCPPHCSQSSGTPASPFFPNLEELSEEEQEAWSEFYTWCFEQAWGPDSEYSGAEQLERLTEKMSELGVTE